MSVSKKKKKSGKTVFPFLFISLWFFSLASSIAVVYSTYESRKATQKLEELRIEANALQVMSGQLLLEKSSWSNYSRVERIALKKLNMLTPELDKTVLVYRR